MKKGKCLQTETALHTHDSICFRRCRRKWFFSSAFSMHLQPKPSLGVNKNLWFGSGFHWAMEDYYGENKFGSPVKAFEAYVEAHAPEEVPLEIDELVPLGVDMLTYYEQWEAKVRKWKVVIRPDGTPMVEVPFSLVLDECCYYDYDGDRYFAHVDPTMEDITGERLYKGVRTGLVYSEQTLIDLAANYQEIVFHGKLDAIVEDKHGNWWVLDYKTAKAIDTAKLALDPQISRYCWAAEQYLEHEIEGMLYIQVAKNPPHGPRMTQKGISADKSQRTTHTLYRKALVEYYGSVDQAPAANVTMLNNLADEETENGNKFIRYDWVPRNTAMKESTYKHIIHEGLDMLHPDMKIYLNPTKDCSWDCPFKDMCVAMEEGIDWKCYLEDFEVRNETLKAELPKWQERMFKQHPDLFPEEYQKHCLTAVESLDDFMSKYGED